MQWFWREIFKKNFFALLNSNGRGAMRTYHYASMQILVKCVKNPSEKEPESNSNNFPLTIFHFHHSFTASCCSLVKGRTFPGPQSSLCIHFWSYSSDHFFPTLTSPDQLPPQTIPLTSLTSI